MSQPLISIVIPTRNRLETLRHAVRTCLVDSSTDYEVIVFDNHSTTPATLESIGITDPRVRIHRSETSLPMLQSWETAVSLTQGQHIMVIGDDDGILPSTLGVLRKLLNDYPETPIRWSRITYNWPNHPYPIKRNSIKIPFSNDSFILESRALITAVANYKLPYFILPMLYNSLIPRKILDGIRSKCGKIFLGPAPDLASGFAIAYLSKSYLALETPLTIGGTSGKSNGLATLELNKPVSNIEQSSIINDFMSLNKKAGYTYPHPLFPNVILGPVISADSFQHVKEALFPDDDKLSVDLQQLVDNCGKEIGKQPRAEHKHMIEILEKFTRDNSRLRLPKNLRSESSNRTTGILRPPPRGYNSRDNILALDAEAFGVSTVFDAAQLCDNILCYGKNGFRIDIMTPRQNLIASGRKFLADLLRRRHIPAMIDCD